MFVRAVLVILLLLNGSHVLAKEALKLPASADIRVLIDISGSMKQNDPHNLRIPALNLITELLPAGNQAGIWTFGQGVNMLVPHAPVDPAWRAKAREKAKQINSVALFTNIGAALEKSFDDYKPGKKFDNTHFILLTDGMVDVSKKPGVNDQERQRLLTKILDRFKQSGAHIHTIALSDHADSNLMQRLAVETGGLAATAKSSEDLSRIFLQALDQAVPAEQVPLKGNQFSIDSSIEEFTALIFNRPGAPAVHLFDPKGNDSTIANHPGNVKWYQDRGYDLITVQKPAAGDWRLDADIQPGSRVTVVTNLRMVVNDLPTNFYPGDILDLSVAFFEDGKQITAPEFLNVIDVDVTVTNEENLSGTKRISVPDHPPADGVFADTISKLRQVGQYTVLVKADGKTFQRQRSQVIQLRSPLDVQFEGTGSGANSQYRLTVIPRSKHIQADNSSVTMRVIAPNGSTAIQSVPYDAANKYWETLLKPTAGDGEYHVQVSIDCGLEGDQKFALSLPDIKAEFPRKDAANGEYKSLVSDTAANQVMDTIEPPKPEAAPEPKPEPQPEAPMVDLAAAAKNQAPIEPPPETAPAEPAPEAAGHGHVWLWIAAVVGGLSVVGGAGAFWFLKRSRKKIPVEAVAEDKTQVRKAEVEEPPDVDDIDIEDELDMVAPIEEPDLEMSGDTQVDLTTTVEAEPITESIVDGKSPEEIADAILADNQQSSDDLDDEFNLEDFDISDTDGLPQSDEKDENKPK